VAVTFDDGYADNLQNALPAMKRYGVSGTVFIATGYIGRNCEYWWDELDRFFLQPGRLPDTIEVQLDGQPSRIAMGKHVRFGRIAAWRNRRWRAWNESAPTARHTAYRQLWTLMQKSLPEHRERALEDLRRCINMPMGARPTHRALTEIELKSLGESSLVEIGAHTVMHPSLGSMPVDVQRQEIYQSKAWLEGKLQRQITSFSYPFGTRADYTAVTMELLKEAGFERSCSNFAAPIDADTDRFQLPRRVVGDWNGRDFAAKCVSWFQ
jgi:peptidoglycan/xylan/chitin deacetylase (PgdA/CDA1 family)